jgi:hypothetical protein
LPGCPIEEKLLNDAEELWKLPNLKKLVHKEWKVLKSGRHPLSQKADQLGYGEYLK